MKNSKKIIFCSFLLTTLIILSCSNKPDFEYDAVDATINKELREGLNPILKSSSGTLELNVKAVAGKKPEYVILLDGKQIESNLVQKNETVAGKKKTTCWECGVDAQGNRHCWKIPCPVIVGPWNPNAGNTNRISII